MDAHPIHIFDLTRLLSTLPDSCALAVQTWFLFRLMWSSGLRAKSVADKDANRHIRRVAYGHNLEIQLVHCKTPNGTEKWVPLLGDLRVDFDRWMTIRGRIDPPEDNLFVKMENLGRIDDRWVTRALKTISECAGYGSGFFTSHSFRHGFVSRVCVEVYSQGKGESLIRERLYQSGQWNYGSDAVVNYINPGLCN